MTLYTKPGCHLCEDVRAGLWDVSRATGTTVREVDITGDAELFERYRLRVPVVAAAGRTLAEGPWNASLRRRLLREIPRLAARDAGVVPGGGGAAPGGGGSGGPRPNGGPGGPGPSQP